MKAIKAFGLGLYARRIFFFAKNYFCIELAQFIKNTFVRNEFRVEWYGYFWYCLIDAQKFLI